MQNRGRLFVFSGPSGAGKSTLIEGILKKRPELQYSISYTTRPPRGNEKNGVDYHFISQRAFEQRIAAGDFAEWAEVHGYLYGTSAAYIDEVTSRGKDVILDIDVVGAQKLIAKFSKAISIFVAPPNMEELEKRLTARSTDSSGAVKQRLKNAKKEMAQTKHYDHVLVNKDLQEVIAELETIMGNTVSNG